MTYKRTRSFLEYGIKRILFIMIRKGHDMYDNILTKRFCSLIRGSRYEGGRGGLLLAALTLFMVASLASAQIEGIGPLPRGATGGAEAGTGTMGPARQVRALTYATPPLPPASMLQELNQSLQNSPRPGPMGRASVYQGAFPIPRGLPTTPPDVSSKAAGEALSTDLSIFRNSSLPAGGLRSGVNEPSTANNGKYIFATGNWYAARSGGNAGAASWTYLDPFNIFGTGFCCDQVTVYDASHDRVFWLLQYSDGHLVLANSDGQDMNNWCWYSWTPANFGLPAGASFDYNHMAVSTNFVYVTTNVYGASGGSLVFRVPIDPQVSCGGFGYNYVYRTTEFANAFVQAAGDTMYWGTNWTEMTLGSTFRVLRWADNSGTYFWYDRTIDPFSFMFFNGGQSCSSQDGVVLNWCQRTDSRMSGGGYLGIPSVGKPGNENEAVVGFAFNAKNDTSHPFPYIRRVYFRSSDLTYLGASEFWGSWAAHLYPDLAPDARGHVGMVFAYGGGTGTAHYYPASGIMVDDDISPTQPWSYNFLLNGAGNPCLNSDGTRRWGDYLTIRPYEPSRYDWIASTFRLTANAGSCGSTASVDVRNIVFGRERDRQAYARWATK